MGYATVASDRRSKAISTIRMHNVSMLNPATRAAFGNKLFGVSPGIVFTSSTKNPRVPFHITSTRERSRQPRHACARRANS